MTIVDEDWSSPRAEKEGDISRAVIITRWYFDNPADIPYFATIPGKVMGTLFPGWDKVAEFGQRSLRPGKGSIIFSKGNVLVSISVNSKVLAAKRYTPYIDDIARRVEAALKPGVNKP
ncbi:MAG: hypothetical protein HY319_17660 [Armatimonadetes bacterium]|nr:hypothetical protein [Armatimonadota bacterium]